MAQPPNWAGLYNWSMRHQDGTRPAGASQLSEDDRRWLSEAMEANMQDRVKRMREIKEQLDAQAAGGDPGGSAEEQVEAQEALLDELQEIVEHIDYARDLHKIGGLPTLLALLRSPAPSVRARAAEVLATSAQNNVPVQQWFLEGGALPPLLELLRDADAAVRQKALLAISALVRHCQPALAAFREAGGLAALVGALRDPEPRVQRKALQLLQYMVRDSPADAAAALDAGALGALEQLLGSDDNDIRHQVLAVLHELAARPATLHALLAPPAGSAAQPDQATPGERDRAGADAAASPDQAAPNGLRGALQGAELRLDALPASEWDSVKEEVDLIRSLQTKLAAPPPAEEPREAPAPAAAGEPALGGANTMQLSVVG